MRYPGLSGDVVGTIDKQTLRNKKLVDPVITVNGNPIDLTSVGGGVVAGAYVLTDLFDGLHYKIIAQDGSIGLQETTSPSGADIIIADLNNGKNYKIVSASGTIGLEEI